MKLSEIQSAQPAQATPSLSDLLYALAGTDDRGFSLQQIKDLFADGGGFGVPLLRGDIESPLVVDNSQNGQIIAVGDDLTIEWTPLEAGSYFWLLNVGSNLIKFDDGMADIVPNDTNNFLSLVAKNPDTDDDPPKTAVATLPLIDRAPGPHVAHVVDADDTSLSTLAASVDALRDALVAGGVMMTSSHV